MLYIRVLLYYFTIFISKFNLYFQSIFMFTEVLMMETSTQKISLANPTRPVQRGLREQSIKGHGVNSLSGQVLNINKIKINIDGKNYIETNID